MHSKTLIALLGIILGIALGEYGSYASETTVFLGCLSLILFLFSIIERKYVFKKIHTSNETKRSFSLSVVFCIFFASVAFGVMCFQFKEEKKRVMCNSVCTIEGIVASNTEIKDSYQIFSLAPFDGNKVYKVQVRTNLYPRYKKGDHLQATGKITVPQVSIQHNEKKVFDYDMYLRIHDIGSQMMYPKIQLAAKHEYSFKNYLSDFHYLFVTRINKFINQPSSHLATGMLFGDSLLRSEIVQSFRVSGLSHIVVLSGFNIAIVISFIFFVLRFLPLTVRIFGAAVFALLFVFMVDAEMSIVRATLMAFIGLSALLVGREYVARQALLLSLICIIVVDPLHAFHDISLHLSFLATAGIVYLSEPIKNLVVTLRIVFLKELFATTLAAYVVTLPYLAYMFQSVSLYALLANILVLPIVPLFMLFTFFTVLSSFISLSIATALGYMVTLLGKYILVISGVVESLPFASMVITISLFEMFFMYVIIFIVTLYYLNKKKNETLLTNDQEIISGVISF